MKKHTATWALLILTGAFGACRPEAKPATPGPTEPAAAHAGASSQAAVATPEIFVAEAKFDAGKVKQGTTIKHTFVVKNRGLGQLNIEKVQGS